ncbi:MAG TPA: hypothetical protein VHY32_12185 [Caulobacteraceae bacterium]|jgi:hypothetical protein|nr:hypothetical protein [Caulobacteraceae bacterium]
MGHLMGWLTGARQAKADARHLRALYGDRAEAWCEGVLAALPPGDARRRSVLRIAKALDALPVGARHWAAPSHKARNGLPQLIGRASVRG